MNRRRRRHTAHELHVLEGALAWAREQGYSGESLPRGRRDDATGCPLALATGYLVTEVVTSRSHPFTWVTTPGIVAMFIRLFDIGRYPELELR